MSNSYFVPQIFSDNNISPLSRGGLVDQLFNASLPWKLLKTFANDEQHLANFSPKLDVTSDDKAYTINAELPGVNLDNIDLQVKNGILVLSGEKKSEKTEGDGKHQHITERSWGSFCRELSLPDDADIDNINATHKDGVLTISIPKIAAKESSKNISINRG